ncbi:class I SAM-dependent DNA methyltransferase [Streptomyces geranii]|uniref:class I SAM-dependent DNA methyltransferase n=1 Tax=Streptomyces geranii TaxID=2058923 RepID=UPI001E55FD21|nr:class I SAM-dependent methyltransferase [Streptomyces geranii]
MAEFDSLAWFYDRYWGPEYAREVVVPLREFLVGQLPPGRPLLDACCGCGHVTAALADWGYRTAGFDLSPAMVERARRNTAPTRLWVADVLRCGARDGSFGSVVCTYNSLNHLPADGTSLAHAFAELRRCLEPGGVLFFDLNSPEAAGRTWHGSFTDHRDTAVCRTDSEFDPRTGTGRARLRVTRPGADGKAVHEETSLTMTAYPWAMVTAALADAGLRLRSVRSAPALGLPKWEGRVFVVAERTGDI